MGKPATTGRLLLAWVIALLLTSGALAQTRRKREVDKPTDTHVKATLICDRAALVPGSTAMLGIRFDIQKNWHLYWTGRNDSGAPPIVEFQLPAGYSVEALQWPAPVRHVEPGDLLNHVYYDQLLLLAKVHIPRDAKPESTAHLKAKLEWMVCSDVCIAEEAAVSLKLPIAPHGDPAAGPSADAKAIDAARARIPRELDKEFKDVKITWTDKAVTISVLGAKHLSFYPDEDCVPFAAPIKDADTDRASMTIRLGEPEKDHTALTGILEIRRGQEPEWYRIRSTPPASILPPGMPGKPTGPAVPNPIQPKPHDPFPIPLK